MCEPLFKVLDFGIARFTNAELAGTAITAHDMVVGTPLYMSPEQVTGATLDADEAARLGVAHVATDDGDAALADTLKRIGRCGPGAVAATKQLMLRVGQAPLDELLDSAAADFALRTRSDEAVAGLTSFLSKTAPPWAEPES